MSSTRTSMALINDARVRALVFQASLILALIFGAWWLVDNTVSNLSEQGKTLGFNFLVQTAGFQISSTLGTWVMDYNVGESTYLDVYFIGIINTFVVAALGILAATVLGLALASCVCQIISSLKVLPLSTSRCCATCRCCCNYSGVFAAVFARPTEQIELIPGFAGINITGLYLPAHLLVTGSFMCFLFLSWRSLGL